MATFLFLHEQEYTDVQHEANLDLPGIERSFFIVRILSSGGRLPEFEY